MSSYSHLIDVPTTLDWTDWTVLRITFFHLSAAVALVVLLLLLPALSLSLSPPQPRLLLFDCTVFRSGIGSPRSTARRHSSLYSRRSTLSRCNARTLDTASSVATILPTTDPACAKNDDATLLPPAVERRPTPAEALFFPPPRILEPTKLPTIPATAVTTPIVAANSSSVIDATVSSKTSRYVSYAPPLLLLLLLLALKLKLAG
mmetsp:Transcript_23370/g.55407  ORF Transcript_23370/g.55407 Transcript_23370/m.55407 type:complete len:204 (+) Transcript_23370:132-743(+)